MLWRHLCLVRAWSAAGLIVLGSVPATAQTKGLADGLERSAPPAGVETATVDLLKGSKAGDLNVVARGDGQERVRLTIRNTSAKRLNVVIPPGLVASAAAGQGGGGRGNQSMGLGSVSTHAGGFGQFASSAGAAGLRSVDVLPSPIGPAVAVPSGETIEVKVPAVCLNYGLATPTPANTFTLMDVADYSNDPRVRKALRSLATLGTSHGVAQAVMWRVCNDLPFESMASQAGKIMNTSEIMIAARFVDLVDRSPDEQLVDGSALMHDRVFVRIHGEGALAKDAQRLHDQMVNYRLLGLPVRALDDADAPSAEGPALLIDVALTDTRIGETKGRIAIGYRGGNDDWQPIGKSSFQDSSSLAVLDGETLARKLDQAIAGALVTVKPARKAVGSTLLKLDNRLPFTLSAITVKAGDSAGAPVVPYAAVGVGPGRSALLPIQAPSATIEHVELNGL
ncbi:hypothetical protein OJF2_57020 [Aquisphaera giovannonii]|uniref:Uncharacterized protein n=1 Tax=Aquisphaera giovannonii TaxID=406548 RepID=A0A5B9WAI9_9BACT|nr:hypothetical protein [Aquisphaera giovannonii]QEH37115.1 hypothetical protein OJF2_57020 [Aquisphaera giovannonii]